MKIKGFIFAIIAFMLISGACIFADTENLVINGGFEEETTGLPPYWHIYDWENKAGVTEFRVDSTRSHSGGKSACIISNSPNDARYMQKIEAKPNTYYRLSCYVLAEACGPDNKGANLSIEGILAASRDLKDTNGQWEYLELYGRTGSKQDSFTVTLGVGGYGSLNTGRAWFDDVKVEEIGSLPEGVTAVDLFAPQNGSGANTGATGLSWVVYIIIAAVALLLVLLAVPRLLKASAASGQAKGGKSSSKVPLTEKEQEPLITRLVLDKKDLLVMAAMTLVYLVLALLNLGDLKGPQTSWTPSKAGESFVVDLGREATISRVYFNAGIGKGTYRLEYLDAGGEYKPLATISPNSFDDFYRWRYLSVSATTGRIKVTVDSPGATLNELGFMEEGSRAPLKGLTVTESTAVSGEAGAVENLFDEQDTIPYNPSYMNGTYFDEIYHARTAFEHLNRIEPYESTHPPLGKIFIALGILVFGMVPFGWRIVGTLFGAAMIPVMYMFGKKMFANSFYAFLTAFLMMFDFMHFSQTRIATIDVYVTFFIILMFYYMFDYYVNKSYNLGFKASLKPLFLSGLFFGFGAASKWIAIYGAAGLAMLFFLTKYDECRDYVRATSGRKPKKLPWIRDFVPLYINGTVLYCILFFVIIPAIIYLLSYIPYMMVPGPGHDIKGVISYQSHMYNYHKNLKATHDFSSAWWQWPIMTRPLWAFSAGADVAPGKASTIAIFGNPAIWWVAIAAVICAIFIAIKKRDRRMAVVLIAIAAQYLPWILVPRIAFIYHFFSIVPFAILAIVYVIRHMEEKLKLGRQEVYVYMAVVLLLFILYYPVISGLEVDRAYISGLRLFKSWIF